MHPCSHCGRTFVTARELTAHLAAVKAAATKRGRPHHVPPPHATPPPRNTWTPPPPPPPPPSNTPLHCPSCGVVFPAGTIHRCAAAPPPSTPPPNGNGASWLGKKQPTVEDARAEVLVALQNLYKLQVKALEAKRADTTQIKGTFEKYLSCLHRAMAPSTDAAMRNEAEVALRVAGVTLWKALF